MDGKSGAEELLAKVLKDPACSSPSPTCPRRPLRPDRLLLNTRRFLDVHHHAKPGSGRGASRRAGRPVQPAEEEFKPAPTAPSRPSRRPCTLASRPCLDGAAQRRCRAVHRSSDRRHRPQAGRSWTRSCTTPTSRSWKAPGAAWRYMVSTETDETLKIRVMNVSKKELGRCSASSGRGLGPVSPFRRFTSRNSASWAAPLWRLGRGLRVRPQPARRGNPQGHVASGSSRPRAFCFRAQAHAVPDGILAELSNPAI